MPLTIDQMMSIGRYLNIFLGTSMFILGVFGSMMNLWLFIHTRLRRSPCSRYILASTCCDLFHLVVALLLRILAEGFAIDPCSSKVILCRLRYYLITFTAYGSIGCRCLAAFDRCMCTSRSISCRKWSSLFIANRLILVNLFFWACFALPNLFFFDLVPKSSTKLICHISNLSFRNYVAYFVNPILYFALPLILLLSFSAKTRDNLQRMKKNRNIQRLERQMTSMILLQALMNCLSSIPYGIQFLYAAVTLNSKKDPYRLAGEYLFLQITRLFYYVNFISSFYIFYISSEQIRQIVGHRFSEQNETRTTENVLQVNSSKSNVAEVGNEN